MRENTDSLTVRCTKFIWILLSLQFAKLVLSASSCFSFRYLSVSRARGHSRMRPRLRSRRTSTLRMAAFPSLALEFLSKSNVTVSKERNASFSRYVAVVVVVVFVFVVFFFFFFFFSFFILFVCFIFGSLLTVFLCRLRAWILLSLTALPFRALGKSLFFERILFSLSIRVWCLKL